MRRARVLRSRDAPFGIPQRGPTFVGSDNKANALIASGVTLPSRSRHCLRRYLTFLQRLRRGEVEVGHVPDVENPSDFLTKWVPKDKSDLSLRYATNVRNVVHATGVSSDYNARAPSPTLALGGALMPTPRDTVWTTGKLCNGPVSRAGTVTSIPPAGVRL